MTFREWARIWGVPMAAVIEWESQCGLHAAPATVEGEGKSEAYAQSVVRLEAPRFGVWLTRNNVGVLEDARGVPVRYGLANESKPQNAVLKSSDLIGIDRRPITLDDVGQPRGRFVARELKKPGWQYSGAGREPAQLAFIDLINSYGGDARFATGEGSF